MKKDGKVAISIWGEKPHLDAWACKRALEMGASNKLTSKSMRDKKTIFDTLNNAKFENISILEESKYFYYENAEVWWESLMAHGTRYLLEQLSTIQLKALHLEAIKKANEGAISGRIRQKFQVFYATAKNFKS